ncbi:glycosyltransferase family 20-domain-containing protein [Entophlyctis helioformis]|nr:glycosyltransferase family 20-domain-containing protein [Entophlyctis helioformis]
MPASADTIALLPPHHELQHHEHNEQQHQHQLPRLAPLHDQMHVNIHIQTDNDHHDHDHGSQTNSMLDHQQLNALDVLGGSDGWRERRLLVVSLFLPVTIGLGQHASAAAADLLQVSSSSQSPSTASAGTGAGTATHPASTSGASGAAASAASVTAASDDYATRRLSFVSAVTALSSQAAIKAKRLQMERSRGRPSRAIDMLDPPIEPSKAGNIGLQNAVHAVKGCAQNRLWIGTVGTPTDDLTPDKQAALKSKLRAVHSSVPVFVRHDELDGHYNVFCKQVLWKPFHYQLPDFPKARGAEDLSWKHYVSVNQRFADAIAEVYKDGDIVWINDYHLLLVPLMVRRLIPTATIGFFLHIPFPSSEIFRALHVRREILDGLLGSDLIGFQTYAFMRHFLMTCTRLLALDTTPKGIQLENSVVGVGIYPIGINLNTLNEKRNHPEVAEFVASLREKYAGKRIVIGRDKNDYIKGVRHKMLAYERFLKQHPEWHGRVVLIQVALSTTEANGLESQVMDVVSRINSQYGAIGYVPVVYLQQDISFNHYLGLLTIADACLITPLRDGMNLTSHEYVVCQEHKHSPLIISEFAGTYGSFGAAIRVNPWDRQEVADAVHDALVMSPEEKKYRWEMLFRHVSTNTAQAFVETFVSDTARVHEENMLTLSTSIPRLTLGTMNDMYSTSRRRLIVLDDEGTLFSPAVTANIFRVKTILQLLSKDPCNIVYLISSRSRTDLDEFFLLPNIGVSAENGCFIKYAGRNKWETLLQDQDLSWRKKVLEVFDYYTDRTPGSHIEQREVSLVWHYGHADKGFGSWQAAECQNHLQNSVMATFPIHTIAKKASLIVTPRSVSKGTAVRRMLEHHQARAHRSKSHYSMSIHLNPHHGHHPSHFFTHNSYGHQPQHSQSFTQHHQQHHPQYALHQSASFSHSPLAGCHTAGIAASTNSDALRSGSMPNDASVLQPQPYPPNVSSPMPISPNASISPYPQALRSASAYASEPGSPTQADQSLEFDNDHSDRVTVSTLGTSYPGADNMSVVSSDSYTSHPHYLYHQSSVMAMSAPHGGRSSVGADRERDRSERIDFVLAIGDDRSDEYMFEFLARLEARENQRQRAETVTSPGSNTASALPAVQIPVQPQSPQDSVLHDDALDVASVPTTVAAAVTAAVSFTSAKAQDGMDGADSDTIDALLLQPTNGDVAATASSMPNHSPIPAVSLPQHDDRMGLHQQFASPSLPHVQPARPTKRRRRIVTCTVGVKSSAARWYLPGVSSVLECLEELITLSLGNDLHNTSLSTPHTTATTTTSGFAPPDVRRSASLPPREDVVFHVGGDDH